VFKYIYFLKGQNISDFGAMVGIIKANKTSQLALFIQRAARNGWVKIPDLV